jgi:hypothetical protein
MLGWLQVTVEIVGIEEGFKSRLGCVGVLAKLDSNSIVGFMLSPRRFSQGPVNYFTSG